MPAFDPTIPVAHTPGNSADIRANFLAVHEEAVAVPDIAAVLAAGNSAGHGSLYQLEQLQLDAGGGRIAGNVQGGVGAQLEFSPPGGTPLLQIRVNPGVAEPQRIICDGGELVIRSTVATRIQSVVILPDLPVADPHVVGQLWNEAGTLKVSAG